MAPGSVPTNATEIFQEGLRIPPLKLREGGRFNDTLLNDPAPERAPAGHLRWATSTRRSPPARSARAACRALAETYGDDHLAAIFEELLDRSEAMTREALRAIPEGTYRYVDFLDNDGIELDRRVRIEVAVTVERRHHDTSTSPAPSPQVRGPSIACRRAAWPPPTSRARADRPDDSRPTAAASGRSRCTCPRAPSSTRREPAPVNARTATIKRITGAILAALAQAVPERVPADSAASC